MIFVLQCVGIAVSVFLGSILFIHIKNCRQLKNNIRNYIKLKDSFTTEDICRELGAKINCPVKKILEDLIVDGEVVILPTTPSTKEFTYKFKRPKRS